MKPSPLKSLTPFVSFGLKSTRSIIACKVSNVLFFVISFIFAFASAYWNPFGMGSILSGVVGLVICWVVGSILQLFQVDSVNDDMRVYNQFVNAVFVLISQEKTSFASDIDTKQDALLNALPMVYLSPQDVDNIESPFTSSEIEDAFDAVLSKEKDKSISSNSAKALAAVIKDIDEESPNHKILKQKYRFQKNIILWLSKKYFNKLTTTVFSTINGAKNADVYQGYWERKFRFMRP